MIARLHERVREIARDIVDSIAERGECDFVVDVAAELPLQVIAELMGVPQADRHMLFEWSNRMIGSEDPEYAVAAEDAPDRGDRDVRLRERARRPQARQPVRRHHQRAAAGRGRRRAAQRPRVRPVLRAARRRRQRDDPQPHLARDAGVDRESRSAQAAARRPAAPRLHRRGDAAVGVAGDVHAAHRAQRLRDPRRDDPRGRQGRAVVHRREPRPERVRGSAPLRHHPVSPTSTRRSAAAARTSASARTSPGSRSR